MQEAGGRALAVVADVTDPQAPANVIRKTVEKFGRIDILVNNAGFTWDGVIQKITPEQWDMMLTVR